MRRLAVQPPSPVFAAALALGLVACGADLAPNQIVGDEQRLVFSVAECLSCEPVAIRTGARRLALSVLHLHGPFGESNRSPKGRTGLLEGEFSATSDDEGTLTVTVENESGRPRFLLFAHRAGRARITIRDGEGKVVDHTELRVVDAVDLKLFVATDTREGLETLDLGESEERVVYIEARSSEGPLATGEGLSWSVDAPSVAAIWDAGRSLLGEDVFTRQLEDADRSARLVARSQGTSRLTVSDGRATGTLTVTVR
jgi:hypothetical protein